MRAPSNSTALQNSFLLAGLDLVLVSRTKSKLEQASQEITDKYSVQTKTIVADFAKQGPEEWAALDSSLAGLDIGVLVNNVGVSYDHAEYFHAIDEQLIDTLIKVNVEALTKVRICCCRLAEERPLLGSGQAESKYPFTVGLSLSIACMCFPLPV